ncbi:MULTISPECIES: nucleotide pyrophosphatase/phosphodiesterase family protein [unclassified Streptomyces]|uniref:nucleotide pyrophosphatase/phosphodiesterase family protein n=1 Tax=unclassified Streptomyces TaxID=2593676 RepID=UPI000F5C1A90|nr:MULTISPECIES: nucleotide pyrophosphatase/phosphodiesterase family protein [unclassified Streptomyces]WSG56295.1 alkaline phosphatase family protein [Streptomyces sp. NBC_01732]WSX07462.1 alkaline phosphatase family protein [Streptomyces sp. NBC_00987]MCX4399740.1 alkaline phosphatase family protein [Streptomyces sp. NBC_01767]MCX5106470.1 alkaline phosphatase family protein [Streptomyces sp. NBC_00439]MCX5165707.1 alkaline phosphatase family protein [Streptomyces sp. NBC_00305]
MTGRQVAVLCTVGLTPRLLGEMPHVAAIGQEGFTARLDTVFPAVTATVQATLTTGLLPRDHGAVANGWYHRDHGEVMMWRQHNALVGGEKVWQAARKQDPDHTTAYLCWWWAMGADVDTVLTPRPVYHYDGRKSPDCYTKPAGLRDELTARQGEFPLFNYWGPTASIASTRWIAGAARHVVDTRRPDLSFIYVPHLDYDLQRYGPDSPQAVRAAREADAALAPLLDDLRDRGTTVVALSEYGISPVSRPVDINRALRREGLLSVYSQRGMEYLDPCTSRAFAVADHQAAHVYVADPADIPRVRDVLKHTEGVDEIWDRTEQATYGIDHPNAGELVAVAEPDAWFTYYYWLDDTRAPDFARGVEIHRKPGYDPAELFFDPADKAVKAKAALTLLRKKAGMRAPLTVVPLDPTHVKGSHGRLPQDHRDGPLLLCSDPGQERDRYHATEVKDLLLRLNGLA